MINCVINLILISQSHVMIPIVHRCKWHFKKHQVTDLVMCLDMGDFSLYFPAHLPPVFQPH